MTKRSILLLSSAFWALIACAGPALADEIVMRIGKDTKSMHMDLSGTALLTYNPSEDQLWAYGITVESVFYKYKGDGNIKINAPILRNVRVNNAYGVIYKGERYMLVDSNKFAYNLVVFGHELGHHVCGHIGRPGGWEIELEADRFSGSFMRAIREHSYGFDGWYDDLRNKAERSTALASAVETYSPMIASSSHPASAQRVASFKLGYEQGSDCLDRKILEVQVRN
jgi:hypothetical protein